MHRRLFTILTALAVQGCSNHPTGSQTSTDTAASSTTSPTTTDAPTCGDGELDPGEDCDDGNTISGDGCESDCTTTPGKDCGNGQLDPGEDCDDGNQTNGDGCENNCRVTVTPMCGDNTVDPGEQCDDGNNMSGDGCESDCTKTPECGDGTKGPGEQCDDGNTDDDDACLSDCTPADCGDGILWTGTEQCDDGPMNGTYGYCLADCTGPGPSCGDGQRNGPEECDDANQTDDDDCSNDCIAPRLVFVTADLYNGNLGGIVGADAKCTQAATDSPLPKNLTWRAWISDDATSPTSAGRMDTAYSGYYKLTSGAVLAHGWTNLITPPLLQAITFDEIGILVGDPLLAWSNTTPEGVSIGNDSCTNWTSSNFGVKGRYGDISATNATWTDSPMDNPINCTNSFRLYCFQNAPAP